MEIKYYFRLDLISNITNISITDELYIILEFSRNATPLSSLNWLLQSVLMRPICVIHKLKWSNESV